MVQHLNLKFLLISIDPSNQELFASSPIRTPLIDNEIVLMNTLYKERFPKATQQVKQLDFCPQFLISYYGFGLNIAPTSI